MITFIMLLKVSSCYLKGSVDFDVATTWGSLGDKAKFDPVNISDNTYLNIYNKNGSLKT